MITLEEARKIITAAEKKAVEIKQPMNIAVVDEGGNLVSHARMDGAWIGSIDISIAVGFSAFVSTAALRRLQDCLLQEKKTTGARQISFCFRQLGQKDATRLSRDARQDYLDRFRQTIDSMSRTARHNHRGKVWEFTTACGLPKLEKRRCSHRLERA